MKKITLILLFLLLGAVAYSVEMSRNGILFSYQDDNAQSVSLVGSMNGWDTGANPMEKNEDGIWEIVLKLSPGRYTYKFIVDGTWQFDQENPSFEDDGYGGSNSLIEIDEKGVLLAEHSNISSGVKSTFNPKVYFKGRYFSENVFFKNGTDRFTLNTPEHDLNFGINVKFSSNFEGYTILNVNSHEEESAIYQTHFNYKRSYLKLKADYFNMTAFDNFGLITFDDPLHIIGDIGYNSYDFGYGFSGVYGETSSLLPEKISTVLPIDIKGQVLFSDRISDSEDDVSAMRLKLSLPIFSDDKFTFGASNYRYTHSPSSDLVQYHDSYEFDFKYKKDLSRSSWRDKMYVEFFAEYLAYENSNLGNIQSVWMEGENVFLGFSLQFPATLKIYADYLNNSFQLGSNFSRDRFSLGANLDTKNIKWDLNAKFWTHNPPHNLNWENYYEYVERTDGNGRWFQQHSEVPFEKYTILGYETGFLWESNLGYKFQLKNHRVETILKNKFAHQDVFVEPKFIESVVVLKYDITDKWKFKSDTRVPYYNDPFLDIKTDFSNDEDVFISSYCEVSYHLSKYVWIALGYGVNPLLINSVTDKFYDRGRDEYLDSTGDFLEYLESSYTDFGDRIRDAEISLMNEKRISLQAVIEF